MATERKCPRCQAINAAENAKICFMCGTQLPSLLTLQNPVFCPSCHREIAPSSERCEHCGAAATVRARVEEEALEKADAAVEAMAASKVEAEQQAIDAEARRVEAYNYATGEGVCPNCKSPNVRSRSVTEGRNLFGINCACCAGCLLTPLAFLLLPFMGGKKVTEFQCQYCSNRWRL